jgi:hypothetical protein
MTTLADFNATFARREQLRRRNAAAINCLIDNSDLRTPVSVDVRPDAVYVTVAEPADLLPWLDELDGVVQVVDLPSGFRVWTLRATYPWLTDAAVNIRVAAVSPLLDDEVPFELRTAVTR